MALPASFARSSGRVMWPKWVDSDLPVMSGESGWLTGRRIRAVIQRARHPCEAHRPIGLVQRDDEPHEGCGELMLHALTLRRLRGVLREGPAHHLLRDRFRGLPFERASHRSHRCLARSHRLGTEGRPRSSRDCIACAADEPGCQFCAHGDCTCLVDRRHTERTRHFLRRHILDHAGDAAADRRCEGVPGRNACHGEVHAQRVEEVIAQHEHQTVQRLLRPRAQGAHQGGGVIDACCNLRSHRLHLRPRRVAPVETPRARQARSGGLSPLPPARLRLAGPVSLRSSHRSQIHD